MNEKQQKLIDASMLRPRTGETMPVDDYRVMMSLALELLADEPVKELKDYTLAELAELVHDMAKEKGWWDAPRDWPEIACLIHSEISEAVECYRDGELAMHIIDGKPEGLVVELADVLIRCLDYAAHVHYEDVPHETLESWVRRHAAVEYGMLEHLHKMHTGLTSYESATAVALCLRALGECCKKFNLDLQAAVVAKIEYNAKRPYRHGGKKA